MTPMTTLPRAELDLPLTEGAPGRFAAALGQHFL